MTRLNDLSPRARNVPESGIIALINHGRLKQGLIPLWVGEGDLPTPDFISEATVQSLHRGETFYTWQRGIPDLRQALADYYTRHFGGRHESDSMFVTGSGMQAIRLAIEAICSPGDEVAFLSPAWPNISAALEISGSHPVPVTLDFGQHGWMLDMDRLAKAIGPKTRALFINTPSNPTGWAASLDELRSILDLARKANIWIIADEIYARYYYEGHRAPSFLDVMEDGDRIMFVNSFSKNWSMTGWRVGWIKAPAELGQVIENMIQYSTSGVPQFMQQGAVAALQQGDFYVEEQKERARAARDVLCDALSATGRVRLAKPDGAFYAFFSIDGLEDSHAAALRVVDEANVGLSPGSGFCTGGDAFLRACFLRRIDHVEEAADRLVRFISAL